MSKTNEDFQKLKEEIELLEAGCAELGESGFGGDDGGDAEEEDDREVFILGITVYLVKGG
jgi:hypothetical protein